MELKAGLEIHQQLDTGKLFCRCPSILRNGAPLFKTERELNPVAGESREIDVAAAFEKIKNKKFIYEVFDTNCLVELDEEPPHEIDKEALKIALQIALLFNCTIFPVSQIMRKTVVDGSNTSGFQRTVLIAHDGYIETSKGKVGIETIALEEDAARPSLKQEEDDPELENSKSYKLDRLGIPLVEITTKPDLKSPEQVKEAALKIGEILRACKVKRGIGTIRQDLNVSIPKGNRIEIKGFQEPKIMMQTVENEVKRQEKLIEIHEKLKNKINFEEYKDVSDIFKKSECKIVSGKKVFTCKFNDFAGIFGTQLYEGKRFGTEISDYAKIHGIKGIIHSDEDLNKYKLSQKEISELKKILNIMEKDAFIIIADEDKKASKAIEEAINRVRVQTNTAVPKEVRKSNPDSSTSFLRPMPGSARMYPETDLELLKISRDMINEAKRNLPKLVSEHKSYLEEFGLNPELITLILKQNKIEDFKYLTNTTKNYNLIAKSLAIFPRELLIKNKEAEDKLDLETIESILQNVEDNNISENDVKLIMQKIIEGEKLEQAIKKEKINLKDEIKKLLKEKPNLSANAYMGLIMAKFKGKVSGKEVMDVLRELDVK